jgi:hypothetical protein
MYSFLNQHFVVSHALVYVLYYIESLLHHYSISRFGRHVFREADFLLFGTCTRPVLSAWYTFLHLVYINASALCFILIITFLISWFFSVQVSLYIAV